MVLSLYGNVRSSFTMLVMAVAKELNVTLDFVSVDLGASAHKAPEYVAKQPFGQIPYLVSDSSSLNVRCLILIHRP